ncbi:unannotated protein [freshwater metagenome]|uniref:Unannotated protein n=1 Tax=freshwater metagenome TaxID=449393 RepID=A0A6J6E4C7_9ZZZZ
MKERRRNLSSITGEYIIDRELEPRCHEIPLNVVITLIDCHSPLLQIFAGHPQTTNFLRITIDSSSLVNRVAADDILVIRQQYSIEEAIFLGDTRNIRRIFRDREHQIIAWCQSTGGNPLRFEHTCPNLGGDNLVVIRVLPGDSKHSMFGCHIRLTADRCDCGQHITTITMTHRFDHPLERSITRQNGVGDSDVLYEFHALLCDDGGIHGETLVDISRGIIEHS